MVREDYADGVDQIHLVGGMVRFDLMTLGEGEDGKMSAPQQKARIIMPLSGFLKAFGSMQQLIDRLIDAGVLKQNEAAK